MNIRTLPAIALATLFLAGCATPRNNYDPLESINRPIYSFNTTVDKYVLRPVSKAYVDYTPKPVRSGVSNFLGNIGDLFAIPPALLQGKLFEVEANLIRVLVNTTAGIGGLFDVASKMDIPKTDADYGQSLGKLGMGTGPYLMLPLLGPSSTRDLVNPAISFTYGPTHWINDDPAKYTYIATNAVDTRAQFLPLDAMLAEQYDQYAYVRDAWLQRRWSTVHDGKPPHPLKLGEDEEELPEEKPVPQNASAPAIEVEAKQ